MKLICTMLLFIFFTYTLDADHPVELTKQEKNYIKIKNTCPVFLCIQYDQLPIDGYANEKHIGIMSDIYQKITKFSGLRFTLITSSSRAELKHNIDTKKCDILSVYATDSTIYPTLQASKPFTQTHFTLISKLDKSFVSATNVLKDKLLVTQLPMYKKYLKQHYPYLNIEVIVDKNEMIQTVLMGRAYAILTLDEQADYIIDKYGYGKLKINGFLAKDKAINVSIGVQKDEHILLSIIEKSLSTIHREEVNHIINSWRVTRYHKVQNYVLVFSIFGVMSLFLIIMLYYQKKLRAFNKELESTVSEKTRVLREVNVYLEEIVAQKVDELIDKDKIMTMQSKQAVMGEMISMIAHQWRQPLNNITLQISNIQIQQMMSGKLECSEFIPTLEEISKTLGYLSETIDDFKTYFHPSKKSVVVEIDELLQKSINFVLARAKVEGIKIGITQASTIEVNLYQNELVQVLLNILNNSMDAYADIQRNDKSISLYALNRDTELWIYVKDEAGGIKEEYLQKIFEPYFSTKGKNGTGLGLYMSQMIIEKQFLGKIEIQTNNGGTVFIIKIPKIHHV